MSLTKTTQTIKQRILLLVMVFITLASSMVPMPVFAHNGYFIKVTYDKGAKKVVGQVVYDDVGSGKLRKAWKMKSIAPLTNPEKSHQEYVVMKDASKKGDDSSNSDDDLGDLGDLKMTFPGKNIKSENGAVNNGGSMDAARAMEISNTLIAELNDYIYAQHPEGFTTFEEFKSAVESARSVGSSTQPGVYVTADGTQVSSGSSSFSKKSSTGRLYLTSMAKGYSTEILESGAKSPLYDPNYGSNDDVINWDNIIALADAHEAIGVYYADAGTDKKPGIMETKIAEFFGSMLLGLQSMLGLYSTNDLVYNQGSRAVGFYGGIMSNDWMTKVVGFHIIFLSIAFSVLVLAIAKLLLQRNLATISTYARISLIDGIKDLIVVMILLGLLFPIISVLIRVNSNIVEIMAGTAPAYSVLGTSGAGGDFNNMSGIIVMFFYFFISIYLNIVFIIRAVTLAFLIATAPLFVMAIAFGNTGKNMFVGWVRELIANIFLQAFFAFIISFFMNIQSSTRVLENLIIAFSLIPLSGIFKGLILGQGGGATTQIAGRAAAQGTRAGAGLALGAGSLALAGGMATGKGLKNLGPKVSEGVTNVRKGLSNFGNAMGSAAFGDRDIENNSSHNMRPPTPPTKNPTTQDGIHKTGSGPENENYKRMMNEEQQTSTSKPVGDTLTYEEALADANNRNTEDTQPIPPINSVSPPINNPVNNPVSNLNKNTNPTRSTNVNGQASPSNKPDNGAAAKGMAFGTAAQQFTAKPQEISQQNEPNTTKGQRPIDATGAGIMYQQQNNERGYEQNSSANTTSTQGAKEQINRDKEALGRLTPEQLERFGANYDPNWRDKRRQFITGVGGYIAGSAVGQVGKHIVNSGKDKIQDIKQSPIYQSASQYINGTINQGKAKSNEFKVSANHTNHDIASGIAQFRKDHAGVDRSIRVAQVAGREAYQGAKVVGQGVYKAGKSVNNNVIKPGIKQVPRGIGRTAIGVMSASAGLAYGAENPVFANQSMALAGEKLKPRRLQQFEKNQQIQNQSQNNTMNNNKKSAEYIKKARQYETSGGPINGVNNTPSSSNNINQQRKNYDELKRRREERDQEDWEVSQDNNQYYDQ